MSRVGLIGFNCSSGIGELNRQITSYAQVDRWLVKRHRLYPTEQFPPGVDTKVCCGSVQEEDEFVSSIDVLVFVETPFFKRVTRACKLQKKRVVCIPMLEWTPDKANVWTKDVDLFLCPTHQSFETLSPSLPCVHFPWPVDTRRFSFRQRDTCDRFLFINGHGGWCGRKGTDVIRRAKSLWPEMPLLVRSQLSCNWPNGVEVLPSLRDNNLLYTQGDVLLAPHSIDGLGLELMEAAACGMPVISTNGLPWNEFPALHRIDSKVEKRRVQRQVDWHLPSAEHLVSLCQTVFERSISQESIDARGWAELHSWELSVGRFNSLVQGGA